MRENFQAVFFDRDGTLNVSPPTGRYITSPNELVLLPGAATAVRTVNEAGVLSLVLTNQRWMAHTPGASAAQEAISDRLNELLGQSGAHLDGVFCCPHEIGECICRKPLPGLFHKAAAAWGIDIGRRLMIGDSINDIAAANAAGAEAIMVGPNQYNHIAAEATAVDAASAVKRVADRLQSPQDCVRGEPT